MDDSIIDVTGQSQKIDTNLRNNIDTNKLKVPFWNHHYVYSFTEIKAATAEQQAFYYQFKDRFLKGEFVDLEGNSNYAFILLFDLLNDYDTHRNLLLLEKQLEKLGATYPRTKAYCLTFLVKKLEIAGDREAIIRIRNQQPGVYQYNQSNSQYSFEGNYWGLGTKYQSKLQLKDEEVKILNRLFYSPTNFGSIEYCFIEIVRVFLSAIEQLKEKSIAAGTTLESVVADVTDVILQKHFKYKQASNNYRYGLDSVSNEIYSNIFKRCENTVREYYGHKRKINTDTYYTTPAAKLEFETKIVNVVNTILPELVLIVKPPDETTEIELYSQNTNRWKIRFDELTADFKQTDSKSFVDNIIALGRLNQKNPSVENIFFEASKFIAKIDKEASLKLYIYYLDYDLKSANFDNKQFTKTIQKSLFQNNDQLHDFEIIISELLEDRNLEKALEAVSKLYLPKRKRIKLDPKAILEVQQQDSGTVELLNEYLQDDFENETSTIKSKEVNNDELKIEIVQKTEIVASSNYVTDILFTPIQIETLEIFSKRNFTVEQAELTDFAKQKGAFTSGLIESINEICYEKLDDILIEEEDEYYIINQDYYKRLLKV
ncbi:MAG: hypothetical protein JST81_13305 [Bacteroidetes bacterium]|nr:hypothetical protein [Bacteroidota bacterium]